MSRPGLLDRPRVTQGECGQRGGKQDDGGVPLGPLPLFGIEVEADPETCQGHAGEGCNRQNRAGGGGPGDAGHISEGKRNNPLNHHGLTPSVSGP